MPITMTNPSTPRGTDAVKLAWTDFMDAHEVVPAMAAAAKLRKACSVDSSLSGRPAFDAVNRATQSSSTPHRIKELVKRIAQTWDRQRQGGDTPVAKDCVGTRAVISGAGPVGLRAAVEAAMMGMDVHVFEKRETFSRVNILTLWKQTADDLISFGARAFYPKFSNMANLLHLGTREIQMVLLKNCLLCGVRFSYGSELVGLQAPPTTGVTTWSAWVKAKSAAELGLPEEEDEDEYVKQEATEFIGAEDDTHVESEKSSTQVAPQASPRGSKGGVAAAAAAFAAKAAAEAEARPELQKGPRRSKSGGGKAVLAAMAALEAANKQVELPPPPVKGGKAGRKGGSAAFTAAAAMFGGVSAGEASANATREQDATTGSTPEDAVQAIDLGIGSLDFKPDKTADYLKGPGQGRLNYLQTSELDQQFAICDGADPPVGANLMAPFDVLLVRLLSIQHRPFAFNHHASNVPTSIPSLEQLAEGEWSKTCGKLGVCKAIDRFSLAIGLVINMLIDQSDPTTKTLESFCQNNGVGHAVSALKAQGIDVENVEYLKGETHYIAVTVKKVSLLNRKVLRQDRSGLNGAPLLARENVDDTALLSLARTVADACGLPETTEFASPHPAKLFDFSTRARCLAPFKVLAVSKAGKHEHVVSFDLAAQPFLSEAESLHLGRTLGDTQAEAEARRAELTALEDEITEAAMKARQKEIEMAAAMNRAPNVEDAVQAATAYGQQRRIELHKRVKEKEALAAIAVTAQSKWDQQVADAKQADRRVAVFPIGDSLLEPFWPQGLGSNRGFHTALDACWAIKVMRSEGLEAALLDRHFSYDVMINQPFNYGTIEPGSQWISDYLTRYHPSALSAMALMYRNPSAKRLFKGEGAVPPRIEKLRAEGRLAARKR